MEKMSQMQKPWKIFMSCGSSELYTYDLLSTNAGLLDTELYVLQKIWKLCNGPYPRDVIDGI